MHVSPTVREVFSYFQNLNLLVLLEDLRDGRTARRSWFSGSLLYPVAHGLAAGKQVRELSVLGQAADLSNGCDYASRHLGAPVDAIYRFVSAWDDELMRPSWLLEQLESLWAERLDDAEFMQEVLQEQPATESEWEKELEGAVLQ
jgi:hypothetical protein